MGQQLQWDGAAQGAKYTATYGYDNLDRLTSGPAGSSYTYGDAAHLHAATSTSGGYSASYDTAGNMTCRAPTSSTTCTGSTPTGAGLTYDNEGQLVGWTSALNGNPTPATAAFAYDGEGARVALKTTTGIGVVTTTDYLLGGLEEQQTVGGSVQPSSTLSEYYPLPGIGTAVRVTTSTSSTSTLSYLASDQLGSVSVALSTSGTVTAQALYSPYGTVRYSSGSMPTAHGYTAQLADGMTGLDYYSARYYDPSLGAFTSADSMLAGGLNRYAYVGGNPTTATDPSGHVVAEDGLELAEQGAEDGSDLADGAGAGVPAAFVQAFGDAPVYVLDPTVTVTEDGVTTTYTDDGNGIIEANSATTTSAGTSYTTSWLRAGSAGFSTASYALSSAENGFAAKIKSAYIPKSSSGQTSGGTGGKGGGSGGAAPSDTPPATQTGSSGANGGAGTTPPTGRCGCWPGEPGSSNVFRHYTDREGYEGIRGSNTIWRSDAEKDPIHARHGSGVYFTDIGPEQGYTIYQVARRLWRAPYLTGKLGYFVDVDLTGIEVLATSKPNIFLVPTDVDLDVTGRIVNGGEVQWGC